LIMLTFEPIEHKYFWNGIAVPSVSSALDLLYGRFAGDHTAADHGTLIHDLCQKYLISFDRSLSTEPEFLQFVKWVEAEKISPFESIRPEHRQYSEPHGYAGTFDILMIDRNWIVDIKTGQESKARDIMQLMAYSEALTGREKIYNLYLTDTDYKLTPRKFSKEQFRHFLCAVDVLNFNKQF
jgi:hypothetical protein